MKMKVEDEIANGLHIRNHQLNLHTFPQILHPTRRFYVHYTPKYWQMKPGLSEFYRKFTMGIITETSYMGHILTLRHRRPQLQFLSKLMLQISF